MKDDHIPVMLSEVIDAIGVKSRHQYIDATLGQAGYTIAVLEKGGNVLAIEQDSEMLEKAKHELADACPDPQSKDWGSFKLVYGNFRNIDEIARNNDFAEVSGIMYDLGISSQQLTSDKRGFSFQNKEAPLDMRMNKQKQKVMASDLLNALRTDQLLELFNQTMEYKDAKQLAIRVVRSRKISKFNTVGQFLKLFGSARNSQIHPATQAFLALRIAVNSEIENMQESLSKAFELLIKGGRIAVVSFHSTEDRVVKKAFKKMQNENDAKILTRKPISPSAMEVKQNPSARSAKLRVIEKL